MFSGLRFQGVPEIVFKNSLFQTGVEEAPAVVMVEVVLVPRRPPGHQILKKQPSKVGEPTPGHHSFIFHTNQDMLLLLLLSALKYL